jgi:(5-formylfuran-3-yl)methyl phosphate synthase
VQLLVSVANSIEARHAVEGGADLIDAKDPLVGALGAVSLDTLLQIHSAVSGRRPVTAAIGDAYNEQTIERTASEYGATGLAFVKVGFAGLNEPARVERLMNAAARGVRASGTGSLVAVAYADEVTTSLDRFALLDLAARAGASGVLLDTADKRGPGLLHLLSPSALTAWVAAAHGEGLTVALAGRLTYEDLARVLDTGADIAGVRGAACASGRASRVVTDKVRALKQNMSRPELTHR